MKAKNRSVEGGGEKNQQSSVENSSAFYEYFYLPGPLVMQCPPTLSLEVAIQVLTKRRH